MEPDPPLNGEFMRESSPPFDWEVNSMQTLQAWDGLAGERAWETSAKGIEDVTGPNQSSRAMGEEREVESATEDGGEAQESARDGDLSPIGLVLRALTPERHQP